MCVSEFYQNEQGRTSSARTPVTFVADNFMWHLGNTISEGESEMIKTNKPESSPAVHQANSDLDAPDLSQEAMEKIREVARHLEEGYVPTSSLFPGTGI